MDNPDYDRLRQETEAKLKEILKQFEGQENTPELRDRIHAAIVKFYSANRPIVQLDPVLTDADHLDIDRGILTLTVSPQLARLLEVAENDGQ